MKILINIIIIAIIIVCVSTINSNATLINQGGGIIYDSDLNISWLQDNPTNRMFWSDANSWANNLSFYDVVLDSYVTDWRLPKVDELSHLYHSSGITPSTPNPFSSVQKFYPHWTSTLITSSVDSVFWFYDGTSSPLTTNTNGWAWAVRDGEVSTVPEPGSIILLAIGMVGILGFRKKST